MNQRRIADSELNINVKEDEIKQFAQKLWAGNANKQTQRWNGRQSRERILALA